MSRRLLAASAAAAFLAVAGSADAAIVYFGTTLSGSSEVPPVASLGSGDVLVAIDDVLLTMTVSADFTGLTGLVTAAHIHCCAPEGTNVGVATTVPTFTGFPSGVTSGSYFHVFDMTDASSYRPGFITASGGTAAGAFAALYAGMKAEDSYFNLHTTVYPGGEIRGQLSVVPEPQTWALMITGFGLAGTALRRRRDRTLAALA
ncbi:CHRD domain-containing protein [Phenylobacterium sp.]|uniref:CHRD domain-containing protein n=1 Tax=Phenylobacterium sp. TaxID=1871053 RepID=UPI002732E5FC|nr:CHRD domain-containing protein [Phenylobacterium sp.]MDP3853797.1 CHRD domain-containing protein [Phenylobacterium sp.]